MLPLRPVMSSGWLTVVFPLGVLIMIGVIEARALLVNPGALPVGELVVLVLDELAALLVLDELAALLVELPEPQPVSAAAAINAATARLTVDARAWRGPPSSGPHGQIGSGGHR